MITSELKLSEQGIFKAKVDAGIMLLLETEMAVPESLLVEKYKQPFGKLHHNCLHYSRSCLLYVHPVTEQKISGASLSVLRVKSRLVSYKLAMQVSGCFSLVDVC